MPKVFNVHKFTPFCYICANIKLVSFNAANAGTLTIYVTTDNIITAKLAAGKHVINKSDSIQLLLVQYI